MSDLSIVVDCLPTWADLENASEQPWNARQRRKDHQLIFFFKYFRSLLCVTGLGHAQKVSSEDQLLQGQADQVTDVIDVADFIAAEIQRCQRAGPGRQLLQRLDAENLVAGRIDGVDVGDFLQDDLDHRFQNISVTQRDVVLTTKFCVALTTLDKCWQINWLTGAHTFIEMELGQIQSLGGVVVTSTHNTRDPAPQILVDSYKRRTALLHHDDDLIIDNTK